MPVPLLPRLRRLVAAASLAAATLVVASPVRAQTLAELYEAARTYDATYLAARAQFNSAEYRVQQVEALNRGSAGLAGSATAGQADLPRLGSGDNHAAGATLSGRYPLFNKTNSVAAEQARRSLAASQADLEAAEQDLIVRLSQAYFDVLAAYDTLTATRANKAAITEQLASAKRTFEVGTATITDSRDAQARFDLASAQEIAAENLLRTRRIALDTLVGRTNVVPRQLALPVNLPTVLPTDVEAWVAQADAAQPAVRRARVALEVARLEIDKARAGNLPTLDAVASAGVNNASGTIANLPGTSKNASVGVQFNWPLYTGGAVQSRIQEVLQLEERSLNELEAARRSVSQATRTAYLGVVSGNAEVRALEAAEASTQLALDAIRLGYRVGVRVTLDVLNAQLAVLQTQRELAQSRYNVLLGTLRLRQAAGTLAPADLQAVSALLTREVVPPAGQSAPSPTMPAPAVTPTTPAPTPLPAPAPTVPATPAPAPATPR